MTDDESQDLDFLIEIFRWPNEPQHRYHALLIMKRARGQESSMPTFDDFRAGVVR